MLPRSLISRVYGVGAIILLALFALGTLLVNATERTSRAYIWVGHTEEVIRAVDELLGDVREAESGQRGFLLTRSSIYADTFNDRVASAALKAVELAALTADNKEQNARAKRLKISLDAKIEAMRRPIEMAEQGKFNEAIAFVSAGRGRTLMGEISNRAEEIKSAEQNLLNIRSQQADEQAEWNRQLILFGGPMVGLIFLVAITMLVSSVRRPITEVLATMNAFGQGDFTARANTATGTRELNRLARSYNEMADRLAEALEHQQHSDQKLLSANAELRAQGIALQARGDAIELLGGMAHRMQAARTDEELADVLRCFLPRALPSSPGALYIHNNSRTILTRLAEWGDVSGLPDGFSPDDCWALRRGQGHALTVPGGDVVCAHVTDPTAIYHCEPVLAGGQVIGLLYLKGLVEAEESFRLTVLTENIALALANHQLQRGLREQSIRDPLTNLFNRRYLEETLEIEVARAARTRGPLAAVMCDVDHFKRFNDTFGHDAGDALLRAVGALIQTHFRDGDIACRYGGEEFAIVAPGADIAQLAKRAERLAAAIRDMSVHHAGQSLGSITMSFGVAALLGSERDGAAVLRTADAALYKAKKLGRDRVVIADQTPLSLAAE
jgi:diguanylate cyclase (GGDEF)-like protein